MPKYVIHVKSGEFLVKASVEASPLNQYYRVALTSPGLSCEAVGSDYFDAFCRMRQQLETKNWMPICFGACQNVYPFGTARKAGAGLMAHKLVMGKKPSMTDLVLIFAEGPDLVPVTVASQKAFFEQWSASVSE